MIDPRRLYTASLWLLLPYVFFHLLWRSRKQPEYRQHIGERFGCYPSRTEQPVIWLHTVSVGETRAAVTLVRCLQQIFPQHRILLTHTTPTGRAASEMLFGDSVTRVYLPYDYPFAVRRFLEHYRPHVGVLLETEVWFNLIHACHASGIPLLLLNARLSDKSARGYARLPRLTRAALNQLSGIAAQTDADALRLQTLGGNKVHIMGNLKFDIEPPEEMRALGNQLRNLFGPERKILLAASTREGEEALILDALSEVNIPGLLLVMVPRHPQRFDEVAQLIAQRGLRLQRRSEQRAIDAQTQIVLGDSMGEMFAYYAACDLAYIGGSLLPFGGQNLIEACAMGKPVLIGPHTYNFAQATELAIEAGAALRIKDAGELAQAASSLFRDAGKLDEMGISGLRFVASNQGATERALELIQAQCSA